MTIQSPPAGDLDGDGTPDVFVQTVGQGQGTTRVKVPATLPIQVLSGRSGQRLWSAGPLPLGFPAYGHSNIQWALARSVESGARPDVFVRHGSPFVPSRPQATPSARSKLPRFARVSGRDGRILWDRPLSDVPDPNNIGNGLAPGFGDLDGDGGLRRGAHAVGHARNRTA